MSQRSSKLGVVEKLGIGVGVIAHEEASRRRAIVREALVNDPEILKAIMEATVQRVLE